MSIENPTPLFSFEEGDELITVTKGSYYPDEVDVMVESTAVDPGAQYQFVVMELDADKLGQLVQGLARVHRRMVTSRTEGGL